MKLRQHLVAIVSKDVSLALLPSFLVDIIQPGRRRRNLQLHATSYLDGLRGLASFSVFAYHYTDYNFKFFLKPYGLNAPDLESSYLQLPYIRIVYAGSAMVHIFFVISGFALSCRPLQCLYEQTPLLPSSTLYHSLGQETSSRAIAKCHGVLASSALRRPIRLFGPPLVLTLIDIGLISMGFMRNFLRPKASWLEQFSDWAADAGNAVAWPWGWDDNVPRSRYNPHLWTIPIEFAHSMLLFVVLLVVSRLRTAILRQVAISLIMVYALLIYSRWAAFEFLGGALLADWHMSKHASKHALTEGKRAGSIIGANTLSVVQMIVLASAGYIISWPPHGKTTIHTWLQQHSPSSFAIDKADRFWFALAAFGTVWACGRKGLIKRALESSLMQYAGRISFAFYILQHPFLNICELPVLGETFRPATQNSMERKGWGVRGLIGQDTPLQRTVSWLVGLCVLGSLLVCLADVFSRTVDTLFVKAARKFENIVFVRNNQDCDFLLASQ